MEYKDYLNIAINISKKAGDLLLHPRSNFKVVNDESNKDVKLQADIETEKLIRAELTQQTQLPIIGEEEGGDTHLIHEDKLYWIIDPLDGTYNYLRDMELCCVSIGLWKGLTPILGVIYDFHLDLAYSGIVGKGFHINNKPITPNWAEDISHACLMTGFPNLMSLDEENLKQFFSNMNEFKKVRMIGSAAISLAYIASGKADVYKEKSVRLWDIAGGAALIEAAGGFHTFELVSEKDLTFNFTGAGKKEWLEC